MLLCEAAGFDVVLVETVGIGQSETAVCDMTDFFLALMLPGAGDELQGIKKGLVELADMIAINKADGDNIKRANLAAAEYRGALHILTPRSEHWQPPVVTYSALTGAGIAELWQKVLEHRTAMQASGEFAARRREQQVKWMWTMLEERWKARLRADPAIRAKVQKPPKPRSPTAASRRRSAPSRSRELAAVSARLRILITGFGPFPGAPYNPTPALVARLLRLRRPAFAEVERIGHIFPVSYRAVDRELPELLARHRPRRAADVRARRAHALSADRDPRPQRRHHAVARRRAHHACATPRSRAAPTRRTFGPHAAKLLRAALATGIDARASRDAGRYLCNYLSWRAIEATRRRARAAPRRLRARAAGPARERRRAMPRAGASPPSNWSTPAKRCCWRCSAETRPATCGRTA